MSKIIVIVESPNKIKKIQSYLGSKYHVMASVGHIIDLDTRNGIDVKNKFAPTYVVSADKTTVVKNLKKAVKNASDVLLATDQDREGEMIAWSLEYALKLKNPKRIVFNSITKSEILKAIENTTEINYDLVNAQKARRIMDMLIGFEASNILRKKIHADSAGRVQSVVVRLIIDKENEIKDFFEKGADTYFKITGIFDTDKQSLKTNMYEIKSKNKKNAKKDDNSDNTDDDDKEDNDNDKKKSDNGGKKGNVGKITSEAETRKIMKMLMQSSFKISDINETESLRHPSAPFTTSTLQQEASRKLGFSVKKTMTIAQSLYAAGYITYMRTDSVSLSDDAIENIKEYIMEKHGKDYYHKMQYKSKAKNTQEAHEAIRPTDANTITIEDDASPDENKLYLLIWKRAIASQMTAAKFKITSIQIDISKSDKYYFQTDIETLLFPGFLIVYNYAKNEDDEEKDPDDDKNVNIKIPKKGTELDVSSIVATQDYQKPPTRYNEASLINKLDPKNLNIGRPSTYANIIDKIQFRKYVLKDNVEGIEKDVLTLTWNGKQDKLKESNKKKVLGKEKNKLVPTDMGATVTKFLIENFPNIMDYKFTAGIENKLDDVAKGKLIWHKVLDDFYTPFHSLVEKILYDFKESGGYVDVNAKILGKHPDTDVDIMVSTGRHGPYVKMGNISASIVKPLKLQDITLEDALKLLEYPKTLGNHKKKSVMLHKGKNGLYVKMDDTSCSVDNEDISLEDAIKLIEDKLKDTKFTYSDEKKTYKVIIGKYGSPCIMAKDKIKNSTIFIKIPKDENLDEITKERVLEIVKNEATKYKKIKEKEDSQKEEDEKKKKSKETTPKKVKAKPKAKSKAKPKVKSKTKSKNINIV